MAKRFITPVAKKGELLAKFGKAGGELDVFYCWNGEGMKSDSRILMAALENREVYEGRSLRQELELRGYDITTLKFSIMKKHPNPQT